MEQNSPSTNSLLQIVRQLVRTIWVLVALLIIVPILVYYAPDLVGIKSSSNINDPNETLTEGIASEDTTWKAPPLSEIDDNVELEKDSYGKELIMHTAYYLGPNGVVQQSSNGLNCQNCHLEAGTKIFGNNYASVASMYPKFRARSGSIETLHKRINDCFERSLNGSALDTNTKEMKAIVAYIDFLGSHVPKGKQVSGSGFKDIAFLNRAADPALGKVVYQNKCQSCHQENGEGVLAAHKREFSYPALWGNQSYNDGAGLYRMSNFAKFVKYNMPQGSDYEHPQLTDEEA
ncbi:MAG: c-type cytochrome, partial [Sediminibacterium sp.]|nr:c-type cytochrome [Sediminibacterium sp.]